MGEKEQHFVVLFLFIDCIANKKEVNFSHFFFCLKIFENYFDV